MLTSRRGCLEPNSYFHVGNGPVLAPHEENFKAVGGREIAATAVLIATGAKYKSLDVPALQRFIGVSVFYTTFGETRFVQDLDVAVIGGGNSAGQAEFILLASPGE